MDLTSEQKKTVLAAFLGWTLDAFDFFLLTFLLKTSPRSSASKFRPSLMRCSSRSRCASSAPLFSAVIGDRLGSKPILMLDIVRYSVLGALAAFSPNFMGLSERCALCSASRWAANGASAARSRWN